MCGIVGYIGSKKVVPLILDGLRRLEYRGYDSAGVAVVGPDGKVQVRRAPGKLHREAWKEGRLRLQQTGDLRQARPSCRRASRVPATRRLSFSAATQRGTGKKPQSGTAERRSTGIDAAQRTRRSATSSAVSM